MQCSVLGACSFSYRLVISYKYNSVQFKDAKQVVFLSNRSEKWFSSNLLLYLLTFQC